MENRAARSTVSVLRTVLHLLEGDPAIRPDGATMLEFRRATLALIAEIEASHPKEPVSQDAVFEAIKNAR